MTFSNPTSKALYWCYFAFWTTWTKDSTMKWLPLNAQSRSNPAWLSLLSVAFRIVRSRVNSRPSHSNLLFQMMPYNSHWKYSSRFWSISVMLFLYGGPPRGTTCRVDYARVCTHRCASCSLSEGGNRGRLLSYKQTWVIILTDNSTTRHWNSERQKNGIS